MVKWILSIAFFPLFLLAQEVKVTAEVKDGVANQPLVGTITVTHEESQEVDTKSFQMDNKPLEVEFLRKVKISPTSKLIVSFYRFELPGKEVGLYALPSVSVQVGGKQYPSVGTTYEVVSTPKKTQAPKKSTATPALSLEAKIEGTPPLYPKQRATVLYRILFSGDIALTEEKLPLLKAKGFRTIGDPQATTKQEAGQSVQILSQRIEAVEPGSYTFAPNEIAGYAYTESASGKRAYHEPLLKAEAPPFTIEVKPFPEKGKPPSFNGAVGSFTYDLSLLSPPTAQVGDKVTLGITITGKGELENVPMPEVCCQPGWSGNFEMGDLPPAAKISGDTKTFTVEVRPLTAQIQALPPLAFSYFDPEKKAYETQKSKPIPLKISKAPAQEKPAPLAEVKEQIQEPPPIAIEGNYPLTESDLHNRLFGSWWALLLIPIGIALLFFQVYFRHYLQTRPKTVKPKTSKELFAQLQKLPANSSAFYTQLQEALVQLLIEKGEIAHPLPLAELPETGLSGEIRSFLLSIEEHRFTTKPERSYEEIVAQAKKWIFTFVALFSMFSLHASPEALEAYQKGEKATTIAEREHSFNTALKLYHELDEEYAPTFGNGKLYYNIGNSFFQLGEYPFAMLYYYRAQALMPEDPKLVQNMERTREKLKLSKPLESPGFPLPRWIQIFFLLAALTFIASSFYIWYRKAWLKQLVILLFLPAAVCLMYLAYLHYLSPIEAALVHPTPLYRDAGEQYAKVQEEPLLAGEKVEVIGLTNDGAWAKIITDDGTIGYIPDSAFRII